MDYNLDINANGEIIGGEWKSAARPDFLWLKEKPAKFTGDYERLADLLNDWPSGGFTIFDVFRNPGLG